jgi:hypothetical protein
MINVSNYAPEEFFDALQRVKKKANIVSNNILSDTKFITIVREPISQVISNIYENYRRFCLSTKKEIDVADFFVKAMNKMIGGNKPANKLDAYVEHFLQWPLIFFDCEIKPHLGIDVYDTSFNGDSVVIDDRLLVCKFERINYCCEAIANFAEIDSFDLIEKQNIRRNKKYEEIKASLFPQPIVDWYCESKYCQHFYKSDIERLKQKWTLTN